MKKILLTFLILGISTCSAHAYYEVQYMNTGAPKNFTPVSFGQNAAWTPNNHYAYSERARMVKRYNAETEAIRNRNNYNFNHNINISTKTSANTATSEKEILPITKNTTKVVSTPITCNGITYYGSSNACSQ